MSDPHASFTGSIPAVYDTCLGPLLFEFSAADMAERVTDAIDHGRILEVACGTGIGTEFLHKALSRDVEIVATDLNPGMLEYAREHRGAFPGVRYELADALSLPFENQAFDGVVCQFGIMFFPDIAKGLAEMFRVLRPGGFLGCNVWDSFETNRVAGIAHETIARYFASEPPGFLEVPFGSCPLDSTLGLFETLGFEAMQAHVVDATIERPSSEEVARGFVEGNPGILEIRDRATASPATIIRALADELEQNFGPAPLRIPLREFVFTGNAPG
ncbi:MAG: methyltransferase domain-containing protein [bacterium]|nr:methyltransferase domain-containing protein [bacterium]MCP5067500.1 methyltransferase domain-containing protein [bacterium]